MTRRKRLQTRDYTGGMIWMNQDIGGMYRFNFVGLLDRFSVSTWCQHYIDIIPTSYYNPGNFYIISSFPQHTCEEVEMTQRGQVTHLSLHTARKWGSRIPSPFSRRLQHSVFLSYYPVPWYFGRGDIKRQ
jgi:hypothetical protein